MATLLSGVGVKSVCEHNSIVGDATEEILIAIQVFLPSHASFFRLELTFLEQAKKKAQEDRLVSLEKAIKEKKDRDRGKEIEMQQNAKVLQGRFDQNWPNQRGSSAKLSPHDALMSALLAPSQSPRGKNGKDCKNLAQ